MVLNPFRRLGRRQGQEASGKSPAGAGRALTVVPDQPIPLPRRARVEPDRSGAAGRKAGRRG
jgi:hypothetical protein